MRFELWLMGQNASVQEKYWELLKNTDWNKDIEAMPLYSVLEVCLEDHIDFSHKALMTDKIFNGAAIHAQLQSPWLSGPSH